MNWLAIVQLFNNPAIQALLAEIETLFQKKTSAQGMAPQGFAAMGTPDHHVALKQAVDEAVAKYVKKPV